MYIAYVTEQTLFCRKFISKSVKVLSLWPVGTQLYNLEYRILGWYCCHALATRFEYRDCCLYVCEAEIFAVLAYAATVQLIDQFD